MARRAAGWLGTRVYSRRAHNARRAPPPAGRGRSWDFPYSRQAHGAFALMQIARAFSTLTLRFRLRSADGLNTAWQAAKLRNKNNQLAATARGWLSAVTETSTSMPR